jgi:preprotein translocase subunit SecF
LTVFFLRDKSKYGIEFTGGTSVQIALKQGVSLTRQDVQDRMQQIGDKLKNPDLASASVYSVGDPVGQSGSEKVYDQYEITTVATNKLLTTVTLDANDTRDHDGGHPQSASRVAGGPGRVHDYPERRQDVRGDQQLHQSAHGS